MRFFYRPGLVCVHDTEPRSYVSLRGPMGLDCPFRNEASSFSDAARDYTWAFAYEGALRDEQQFVFSYGGPTVVGEVQGGEIVVVQELRLAAPPSAPARGSEKREGRRGARIMAIFPGVQSPGAGWGSLSHASANNESAYMAHGMSYVSAYLKSRGHHVWLLDTRGFSGWRQFALEVKRQDYDFAMLGPLSIEAFTAACIVRILKEMHPDRPVILGGLHVSMTKNKVFPPDDLPKYYFCQEPPSRMKEFLALKGESAFVPARWPKADYCVWNEGELVTAAIVEGEDLAKGDWDYERSAGGTVFLNGKIVPDLNTMPHMDRSLFNEEMEKQHPLLPELPAPFHTITFGRGCPYKCSYSVTGDTLVFVDDEQGKGVVSIASLVRGEGIVRECSHGGQLIEYPLNRLVAVPSRGSFPRSRRRAMATVLLDEGVRQVMRVLAEDNLSIKATPEHRLLCNSGWRRVDELQPGDVLRIDGPNERKYGARVKKIENCLPERVYDLTVPDGEAFIANGFVSHNCSVGVQFSSSKVRLIEPDYFMEELHALARSNGGHIGSIMIHDDILLFPKWLEDWNEKIKQQFGHIVYWCQMRADFIVNHPQLVRHMAEAGMVWVSVGYEVGHARGLNGIMNKGLKVIGVDDPVEINVRAAEILRSIGVNSFGNFMFGNPTETNEEMDATVRMIQRIQPQHQGFSTYCDFPGTPMSDLIDRENLRMPEWYARSHYPWQYRLRGVDYNHVNRSIQVASQTPRTYLTPPRAGIAWRG